MERATLGLLLAVAAIGAGCGGDDSDDQASAPPPPPPAGERSTVPVPGGGSRKAKERPKKEPRTKESRSRRKLERLPQGARTKIITHVVTSVAASNGLRPARVTVSADGRKVGVGVGPKVACAVRSDAASRTAEQVRSQLSIVKQVGVTVGGRSFAAHRSGCRAPVLPGGRGRVVFSKNGVGNEESPEFRITAKRWTISYRNESGFFSVFVYKNGKAQKDVITTLKAKSGTKTFRGPGTFKLRISGGSPWAVTVRNGG